MKIHHLRSATFVIEVGSFHILIDPMLSRKGKQPSFARFRHNPEMNPTVSLPENTPQVLEKVTHCLITHCQAFGVKALHHVDHLDAAGLALLRKRDIPVVCREQEFSHLEKTGVTVMSSLTCWNPVPFLEGKITAVPAKHGHGWIHNLMANGIGYFIQFPGEPSIYISGDTVFTNDVKRALAELKPNIAVVAAGNASLDVGGSILMDIDEVVAFSKAAPGKVIANHLEALNHCPTTRGELKTVFAENGLSSRVLIPNDGETLEFSFD